MKLSNSIQMREIDKYAIEKLGISGVLLMRNAAEHLAAAALEYHPLGKNVAIFCGTGNNGGDGLGAAAILKSKGINVRVYLIGIEEKLSNESSEMLNAFKLNGGILEKLNESSPIIIENIDLDENQYSNINSEIEDYVNSCGVIIDAIFGIGLSKGLEDEALQVAEMINASDAFVISADIPSGVMADTGAIPTIAVKADLTITFSLAKNGHFIDPGSTHCGEIRILNIGIPYDLLDGAVSNVNAVLPEEIVLPNRKLISHKGDNGRCYIVSGSLGYTGAPVLCARAASKTGAGLVFLGVPERIYDIIATKLVEEMPSPLSGDKNGRLTANTAGEIIRKINECDVVLIGPGLGLSSEIKELVKSVLPMTKIPMVLDADGINSLQGDTEYLKKAEGPVILTPHHGEFVRLIGHVPSGERLRSARTFAKQYNCYLVLKGHRTIMAMPDGTAYINTTGGPAMAKGGAGDVLAGMITAFIGQKLSIKDAIISAVFLHGYAGDLCAKELGDYSVSASDIIDKIPQAIMDIQEICNKNTTNSIHLV